MVIFITTHFWTTSSPVPHTKLQAEILHQILRTLNTIELWMNRFSLMSRLSFRKHKQSISEIIKFKVHHLLMKSGSVFIQIMIWHIIHRWEEEGHIEIQISRVHSNISNRLLTKSRKHRETEIKDIEACQEYSKMLKNNRKWKRRRQT